MNVKFLGAAGQVTGSSFLLTAKSGQQILIDCGMFQGASEVEQLNKKPIECNVSRLKAVLLTHAHLDHCGRLPLLTKMGYQSTIYMTPPTKDITEISLFDTAHINEENEEEEPLYVKSDVIKCINSFRTVEYHEKLTIGDFEASYYDAGHIIGSGFIQVTDKTTGEKIVFSGDLGNTPQDLINPTEMINSSDSVVLETTYGDRNHPDEDINALLLQEVLEVEKNMGTLLIPSFSIERSQEIVHRLSHLKRDGKIAESTSIFFDSPMGEQVTEVFESYINYFNKELSEDIKTYDPFHFPGIYYTKNSRESRKIAELRGAKVIIAGSGMMTGGRILNHAKTFLPLTSTRLLFVGYQAEDTLGRNILEGERNVSIDNESFEIKATVNQIHGLSSHADQNRLLAWLKNIKNAKNLFLVHGEQDAREAFAKLAGIANTYLPNVNEEIKIQN